MTFIFPVYKEQTEYQSLFFELHNIYVEYTRENNILRWEDHIGWWEHIFEREYLYRIHWLNRDVGYIRVHKYTYEISMAIYPDYCNVGIGTTALKLLKYIHPKLYAEVQRNNERSFHFFEKKNHIPVVLI